MFEESRNPSCYDRADGYEVSIDKEQRMRLPAVTDNLPKPSASRERRSFKDIASVEELDPPISHIDVLQIEMDLECQ